MKSLSLLALVASAAAATSYPEHATIVPMKYNGTGCPIQSTDRRTSVVDYMWATYFDDNGKIPGVFNYALNLPFLLGAATWGEAGHEDEEHRYCTHEWKFVNSTGYRLVAHTNGTEIIARYRMHADTSANWRITYYPPDDDETVDTMTVKGPLGGLYSTSNPALAPARVVSTNPSTSWKTGCNEEDHVVKMKTESSVEGSWGTVWGGYEGEFYQRIMQTLSYSWEKCA